MKIWVVEGVASGINDLRYRVEKRINSHLCLLENHEYSQVPIKRVGPNKRVGWIF